MKSIPVIDSLRGLAAIMVCLFHFVFTTTGLFEGAFKDFFFWGKYGVQIFFVLSGVVIPFSMIKANYRLSNFKRYFFKRLVRIEPPYLFSLLIAVSYTFLRELIPGTAAVDLKPDLLDIGLHLGYLVPYFEGTKWLTPVYWTLAIEFQYYIFLCLLFPLLLKGVNYRYFVVISGLILSILLQNINFLFVWLPLFYMGIFAVFKLLEKISVKEFILILTLCAISISYTRGVADLLFGLSIVFVIMVFPYFSSRIGRFFGRISYSLYLLHSIIGAAFINFTTRYTESFPFKVFIVLVGLIISVISAYIFYLLIEKPTQEYSKSITVNSIELEPKTTTVVGN